MSISRRELYAAGEPFGDSATRIEAGRRVYGGGGSGGGSTTATQYTSNVPEYAKQPFMDMIGKGVALSEAPYQAYGGERVAQFTPMQQQAFQGVGSQQVAGQIGQATGLAGAASQLGLGAGNYQTGSFNPLAVNAPSLNNFMMGPAQQVGSQSFLAPGTAGSYMSPYMQQVVDLQKREAARQSDIRGTQEAAQMTKAGAFGGAREAILSAERERNLGQQMSDIQATGSQAAFQQAQQQFNAEQDAAMRASMANQQAGLTTGQANLQSLLQTQGLGAQTGMQAQTANQQALADAQKAFEQSRQFGAGLGLEGAQLALQGAGQLGQLGQTQFGQQMDIYGAQQKMGAEQQAAVQRILDQQYADFQQQRDYPYQQLGFLSDLLRGTGSSTRSIYSTPQPSGLQTIAGLGSALYGASSLKAAKGGEVKGYAAGGGITGLLGDQQLQKEAQQPRSPMMGMAAQEELADRGAMRQAAALQQPMVLPPDDEAPTREELMQILDMALAEGDLETAQAAQEMLSQMGAGVAALGEPDITEEGIAMAAGGPVSFAEGQTVRSPYQPLLPQPEMLPLTNMTPLADERRRRKEAQEADYKRRRTLGADYSSEQPQFESDWHPMGRGERWQSVIGASDAIGRGVAQLAEDKPLAPFVKSLTTNADVEARKRKDSLAAPAISAPGPGGRSRFPQREAPVEAPTGIKQVAPPPPPAGAGAGSSGMRMSAGSKMPGIADFGFDAEAYEKERKSGIAGIIDANRSRAEAGLADFNKMVEERGLYGEEQEARLQARLGDMVSDKERAKASAFLQAGLAILSADPSKGAWSAIGTGGLAGLGAYKGDVEKIETRREQILGKMDEIENMRRQERVADDANRLKLKDSIRAAETEGAKMYHDLAGEMGTTIRMPIAKALFEETMATRRSNAELASRERIAKESARTSQSNLKYADLARRQLEINTQIADVRKNALKPYEQFFSMLAMSPTDPKLRAQAAEINRMADDAVTQYVTQSGAATTLAQIENMMVNLAGTQDVGADGFGELRVKTGP